MVAHLPSFVTASVIPAIGVTEARVDGGFVSGCSGYGGAGVGGGHVALIGGIE
jgi:hypothetical protein